MTMKERVTAGIAVLDKYVPDWRARIDLETLDMGSSTYSIDAQLFPRLSHAQIMLCFHLYGDDAYDCGFDIFPWHDLDKEVGAWQRLTEGWKQELRK